MAKKDVSAIVSGMGLGIGIIGGLVEVIKRAVQAVKNITVNYGRTLADMIAEGKFDGGVNSDIAEKNFPHTGSGIVELKPVLLYYGHSISSSDVLKDMEVKGLQAANMVELVAYGTANPDEQRKYPIVALGQVTRIWFDRSVGVLCVLGRRRYLELVSFENDWYEDSRFLAFRK